MPRRKKINWARAQAEYELTGCTLYDIAKKYRVDRSAVLRHSRDEGWQRGALRGVVDRRIAAVREMAMADEESQQLPDEFRKVLERVVESRLRAEGYIAELDIALSERAIALLRKKDTTAEDLETISRVRKNITAAKPLADASTHVTVAQQASAQTAVITPLSPRDALADLVRRSLAASEPAPENAEIPANP